MYQLKYLTFLFSFLPLVRSGERTEILLVSPEHATGLIHPNLDCLAEYISKYSSFIWLILTYLIIFHQLSYRNLQKWNIKTKFFKADFHSTQYSLKKKFKFERLSRFFTWSRMCLTCCLLLDPSFLWTSTLSPVDFCSSILSSKKVFNWVVLLLSDFLLSISDKLFPLFGWLLFQFSSSINKSSFTVSFTLCKLRILSLICISCFSRSFFCLSNKLSISSCAKHAKIHMQEKQRSCNMDYLCILSIL